MKQLTGFYNLKKLSEEQLKSFFTDAVMLSYDSHIDKLDCSQSWSRQRTDEKTVGQMLNETSLSNHNTCINRNIQHSNCKYAEIGYCTLGSVEYFLYIYLTLDNLKILTDKYSLIME